ncbi:MAG: tetratricopeptide repeat protein [Terracidiphilus sp.]
MNPSRPATAEDLYQQGIERLLAGDTARAARFFRSAIAADPEHAEAHHGLVRALCGAGRLEQAVGVALALTVLTPADPLAHTALSLALHQAGHAREAETAASRARVLEWKQRLQSPPGRDFFA